MPFGCLLFTGILFKVRDTTEFRCNFYIASTIRGGTAEDQKSLKVFQEMEEIC